MKEWQECDETKVLRFEDREIRLWVDSPARLLYYGINQEKRFILEILTPEDVVCEAGVCDGLTTVLMAGRAKEVYAFEPIHSNVVCIRRNLELNNTQNVTVVEKAVGAESKTAKISRRMNGRIIDGERSLLAAVRGVFCYRQVNVVTLDEYFADRADPTFLKIDVEGYEIELLQGAERILKSIPKIAMEVHPRQIADRGMSQSDIFRLIDTSQYELFCQLAPDADLVPEPAAGILSELSKVRQRHFLYFLPKRR